MNGAAQPLLFIGIDPDLHSTAICVITDEPKVEALRMISVPKSLKERDAVVSIATSEDTLASQGYWSDLRLKVAAVAVEAQEITYTGAAGGNPRDILHLGNAAGVLLGLAASAIREPSGIGFKGNDLGRVFFPRPSDWKGSMDKVTSQKHSLMAVGWGEGIIMGAAAKPSTSTAPGSHRRNKSGYRRPDTSKIQAKPGERDTLALLNFELSYNQSDWKHMLDALGLALWARKTWHHERRHLYAAAGGR